LLSGRKATGEKFIPHEAKAEMREVQSWAQGEHSPAAKRRGFFLPTRAKCSLSKKGEEKARPSEAGWGGV